VTNISPVDPLNFDDIEPGQIKTSTIPFTILTQNNTDSIDFNVSISSEGWEFWSDSFTVDLLTGISAKKTNIPNRYDLSQNYPNPFNPSTTIEFDLPKTSEVSLKVFNILGEKVATLLSGSLLSGSHSVEWDASNLASGVYLYRLQAGTYVEIRKMVLMR